MNMEPNHSHLLHSTVEIPKDEVILNILHLVDIWVFLLTSLSISTRKEKRSQDFWDRFGVQ